MPIPYWAEPDDDECSECGDPLDDGEGWNGLCGSCADVQESHTPDDHDRRFSDLYDTQNGDCGEIDPPY